MRSFVWAMVLGGGVLAAACGGQGPPVFGPQVWIDAPLPGAHLPLVPYDVISHANSPSGVAAFELSVNGQVLKTDTLNPPEYGQTLAHIAQNWAPAAPGTYLIGVRASDVAGSWGGPAEVRVTVGEEPTVTPTLTPTPTPEAGLSEPEYSADIFFYGRAPGIAGRSSCEPDQITIMTMAADPRITSVALFFRLADTDSSDRTEWTALAMNPQGGGEYSRTLMSSGIPGYDSLGEAYLQVQLVASDGTGAELARTEVFGDVMLMPCP